YPYNYSVCIVYIQYNKTIKPTWLRPVTPGGHMERIGILAGPANDRPFRINLEGGELATFELSPEVLSVRIAQRVLRGGFHEMWNSLSIFGEVEASGAVVLRVMVFNPDWDGPVQIAALRSWPGDPSSLTVLGCNLDHIVP